MPGPYDYSLNLPDPAMAFMQSLQIGQQLKKQQQQQALQQRRAEIYANLGPNATADQFIAAATALPEDSEALMRVLKARDEVSNKAMFDAGGKAWAQLAVGTDGKIDPTRAIETLTEYAAALENSGKGDVAKQFRDAVEAVKLNPENGRVVLGTMLAMADPTKFKAIADIQDGRTAFQKDYSFVKETFGDDAAAEFAQFGRGGIVSIPMGNGQTYVGPASLAPGAGRWQEQGAPAGQAATTPDGAGEILGRADSSKRITQAEADVVRQSFGPNGRAAFDKWLTDQAIRVVTRTGTAPDGRRVIQYADGTIEYAD